LSVIDRNVDSNGYLSALAIDQTRIDQTQAEDKGGGRVCLPFKNEGVIFPRFLVSALPVTIEEVSAVGLKSRVVGLVGALTLILGGAVGIAAPAQAASTTYWYLGCNAGNTALVFYPSTASKTGAGSSMTAAVGDSVGIVNSTGNPVIGCTSPPGYALDYGVGSTWVSTNNSSGSWTYQFSTGDSSLMVRATGGTPTNTATMTVTLTGGGGGGGGGGSSSSSSAPVAPVAPANLLQQVGLPVDGKCTSITDTTLNWAGVTSGGWASSWAQWMNGGKGGAVCNRTLVYSLGSSKWILG